MKLNPEFYQKTTAAIWKGRDDGNDLSAQRWHQRIILLDLLAMDLSELPLSSKGQGIALIGFACDEGIKRNGGRPGAYLGPDSFRQSSGSLPVHFEQDVLFADLGNVVCRNGDMEIAQQTLAAIVNHALSKGFKPLIIGGGHEVTFAHYTGINSFLGTQNSIGIINFDAHFDMRQPGPSGPNSGTGFYQIAEECRANQIPFRYLPIGIQKNSNTKQLFERADQLGVQYILSEELHAANQQPVFAKVDEFIGSCSYIYLTICMDVFSSAVAPGVSAPAYSGIFPDPFFFKLLKHILNSGKVISKDIAELNPTYDQDQRTAKLVAALAFEMLQ